MFSDAIASPGITSSGQEEISGIGLDAGENSLGYCHNIWDSLAQDAIGLEVAAGPGALWEIDLQTLEEALDLEFDERVGGDFSYPGCESHAGAGPAN